MSNPAVVRFYSIDVIYRGYAPVSSIVVNVQKTALCIFTLPLLLRVNPIGFTAFGRFASIYPPAEFGFEFAHTVSYILIHIFPSSLNANKQSPSVDTIHRQLSPNLDINMFM